MDAKVSWGERRLTCTPADITAIEREIGHKSTTPILHKDTDVCSLVVVGRLWHIEDEILQRTSL